MDQSNSMGDDLLGEDFSSFYMEFKPFFQIFRLFFVDYEFYKEDIIQIWEAQEVRGQKTFMFEWLKRREHIFQLSRLDHSTHLPRYKLHNSFVHFLQQNPSDGYVMVDSSSVIPDNTRHLSIKDGTDPEILKQLCKIKTLETLLISKISEIPPDLFVNCPLLSVLHLSETNISKLPSSVGNSKLRYLNLSGTPITTLPYSLCNCSTMQTLKLRNCIYLDVLPKGITKMTNLHHLEVDVSCLLVSMPPGIGKLTQLETLPAFVVGTENGCRISELRDLRNLGNTLSIFKLENISSSEEAKEAALNEKYLIHKLELHWSKFQKGFGILESLQPHTYINELEIMGYGGQTFPKWIGNPVFNQLAYIRIHDCQKCTQLPTLWNLHALTHLFISAMHSIHSFDRKLCNPPLLRSKESERGVAFPKLKILTLNDMPHLKTWIGLEEGDYPLLQELNISCCSNLLSLPEFSMLKSLQDLNITGCPRLDSIISKKGVPGSLSRVVIIDCPLLTRRYIIADVSLRTRRYINRREDMEKLATIADVWFDCENISQAQPSTKSGSSPMSSVSTPPNVPSEIEVSPASVSRQGTITKDKGKGIVTWDKEKGAANAKEVFE